MYQYMGLGRVRESHELREVENTKEEENNGLRVDRCPGRPSISTPTQCLNSFSCIALYLEKPFSS